MNQELKLLENFEENLLSGHAVMWHMADSQEHYLDLILNQTKREEPAESNQQYVTYEGVKILDNYNLTCPLGENRIAFYAKEDGVLCYEGLNGRQILKAEVCEESGSVSGEAWIEDGRLYGKVTASRALLITLKD